MMLGQIQEPKSNKVPGTENATSVPHFALSHCACVPHAWVPYLVHVHWCHTSRLAPMPTKAKRHARRCYLIFRPPPLFLARSRWPWSSPRQFGGWYSPGRLEFSENFND